MMGSILVPAKTLPSRKNSYSINNGGVLSLGNRTSTDSAPPCCKKEPPAPPLPPRRHTLNVNSSKPLKLHAVTLSGGMDSRYYRPSSPRGRFNNPGRSSTGTFSDPYYDPAYYPSKTSPRSSSDRIGSSHQSYASQPTSSGSRTSNVKYDSYTGRPRRNTLNESDDRLVRPNVREIVPSPVTTSIPIRAPGLRQHHHYDRPSSPLAQSWDNRDTFVHHGPTRHEHKKIYSVDDNNHKTKLVAERDVIESPRRRDSGDPRTYSLTSGGKNYHPIKTSSRTAELNDDGYSYTDPASMYRDTEPAWRRPRSGSIERGSRPTSMIVDRGPRSSNRELGPPPSTRGFDKINHKAPPRREHARSSSIERSRESQAPTYDSYPEAPAPAPAPAPTRSSSLRRHAPAVHQEPREHRRDTYDEYDRRDRDTENRRHPTVDRFEDREVASRGFGIAPTNANMQHDHSLDRQPVWNAHDAPRQRPDEYAAPAYYPTDRADARMPEPRIPHEREVPKGYDERPRERDRDRRDTGDRGHTSSAAPIAAGAAVGAMATLGAAEALKAREKERERERERDRDRERERERERERDAERERERRRERDERDRRERDERERRALPEERHDSRVPDERRDRAIEDRKDERRDRILEDRKDDRVPLAAAAYASTREPAREPVREPAREPERKPKERSYDEDDDRKPRERRHEDEGRDRKARRAPSSDGSGDERPRHYVDREAPRESERQKEPAPKEAALDPDEEYRRRIAQEAERSGRSTRDREGSDSDREKDRRRRKDERARSRSREPARAQPLSSDAPTQVRYDDRPNSVSDAKIVQEPDSMEERTGRSVTIVTPPEKPEPKPRGILRKPTEKFPEDPDPIREGVAPHKSQLKGKDIPVGARWTKIDRRLVNPEALEEAKERFEERMDCVIVLRVLTKEQIQKLADRTTEIREARENEYERHDRRDDRRSHRSHRDDEDRDRDRRRDYDETDDEEWLRERERQRDRDRPRMIEAGR